MTLTKFFATAILTIGLLHSASYAQVSVFSYQGQLQIEGAPANGNYDFEFRLFDAVSGGVQIGSPSQRPNVAVANGLFTTEINFGLSPFTGAERYMEISVRPAGQGSFVMLDPRVRIHSTPYAMTSVNALQLNGTAANQFVVTTDPRMTDARTPTAGSSSYIQNHNGPQQVANFSINGTGSASRFNATAEYQIAGFRMLSILGSGSLFVGTFAGLNNTGPNNTFVGVQAGETNAAGTENVFLGYRAGRAGTTASNNTFVGSRAGDSNITGSGNSFFGTSAGTNNLGGHLNSFFGFEAGMDNTANGNSFFGHAAGRRNTSGGGNAFFGDGTGYENTTGSSNSYFGNSTGRTATDALRNSAFGAFAGQQNTGSDNSFFGFRSGVNNSTGTLNTFVGIRSGDINQTGSRNTIIGADADVGTFNLNYATAIGAEAVVNTSNTVVLGRPADAVNVPGNLNVAGTFTGNLPGGSANYIQNTTATQASSNFNISGDGTVGGFMRASQYNIGLNRVLGTSFLGSIYAGVNSGTTDTGPFNSFFGTGTGSMNTSGYRNTFLGYEAGEINTTGDNNTLVGAASDVSTNDLSFATAIGAGAVVYDSNTVVLGRPSDVVQIGPKLNMKSGGGGSGLTVLALGGPNSFHAGPIAGINSTGGTNAFFGSQAGVTNTTGCCNSFFGYAAGMSNSTGFENTFVGREAGNANTTGNNNTVIGTYADVGANNLSFATAIGARAVVSSNNSLVLGRPGGEDTVRIPGQLQLNGLASSGSISLCRTGLTNLIATCSSSLRFKTDLRHFSSGLDLVKRLKPIAFAWKDSGMHDLGLGAEDVAAIEPLLVTYNKSGQVEGVKYDRIGVVLINAVKEQQKQIEEQKAEIEMLKKAQTEMMELKKLVCAGNREATVCRDQKQ